ncbi:SDR family oxidoreductase [Henriciella sp.]|uniref:SDR family oxidoreductase n=1 Tax=Henriciella sp. TaxID=1968823 RepID=UPI002607907A|nr:SDR family oxidoreductase [Henriciella sp.]
MTRAENAVITGGASGMGLEMARYIIDRGGQAFIADMDDNSLNSAREALGARATVHKVDVSSEDDVEAMARTAFDELGHVDLVFANAGLQFDAPVIEASAHEFDLQIGTNIKGSWMTARAFVRRWIDREETGRICFTGSEHSLGFQHDGAALYTATKHAILGLADVMRREMPDSVGISVFCPGLVNTSFYASREKAGLKESEEALTTGEKLMSMGMPASQAAQAAVEGARAGKWLIVTHAVAREGAKERWQEIDEAFQDQAPPGSDARNYKVRELKRQISQDS